MGLFISIIIWYLVFASVCYFWLQKHKKDKSIMVFIKDLQKTIDDDKRLKSSGVKTNVTEYLVFICIVCWWAVPFMIHYANKPEEDKKQGRKE